MTDLASPPFFRFELDFAESLRCIPMSVRRKLDLCAIKLSLKQWSRFLPQEREDLLDLPCETAPEREAYRARLLALIALRSDEPPRLLLRDEQALWRETDRVPNCVLDQAATDRVTPPDAAAWRSLSELQRFALVKLARSQHENENFVPALIEFGLLDARAALPDRETRQHEDR